MPEKKDFSMETRVLIAFALSALILISYPLIMKRFFPPPPAPASVPQEQQAKTPPLTQPNANQSKTTAPAPAVPAPAAATPPAPAVTGIVQASQESETVVENDLYRVVLSNRGAVVKSWILKKYNDNHGKPLELVNQAADAELGYPLMDWTDDEALREKLKNALFVVKASSARAPATITFEFSDGATSAKKEFKFEHASYVAEVSSDLHDAGAAVPHYLAWRGSFGDQSVQQAHGNTSVVVAMAGKVEHHAASKVKDNEQFGSQAEFAGIEDLFFAAVFMPPADAPPTTRVASVRGFQTKFQPPNEKSALELAGVAAGGAPDNSFRLFVGPKALDVLNSVYPVPGSRPAKAGGQPVMTLGELLDFGWFSLIARPLFLALKWIYAHIVPNYGWAIVIITVVINFLLFPFKLKGMKSALKMQKAAPKINAIRAKYKGMKFNDPKKAQENQEIMALYKAEGINPMGSCLPMVIQIPFLYAFYKVLAISIEMRHAPWVLWVHDLSARDPYYILPIIMTITMYVLQRMTPQTTTDPAQQKMFQFMPLIFGFMFMNVSSGLVLYWLIGNVVGLAQQWYINRIGLAPAKPAAVPARQTVKR